MNHILKVHKNKTQAKLYVKQWLLKCKCPFGPKQETVIELLLFRMSGQDASLTSMKEDYDGLS